MLTMISISERTNSDLKIKWSNLRTSKIVIHDGPNWQMGNINNEQELKEMLSFLGVEMTKVNERYDEEYGKTTFYHLNKLIENDRSGGFWSLDELREKTNGRPLKRVKGLSNGSIVDCYVEVFHDVINVYRPNPNAKEVYNRMDFEDEMKYRRNNWYL